MRRPIIPELTRSERRSWRQLVDSGDLPALHRVLTGLDRDSIEMREVSPMSGLLEDEQRRDVVRLAVRCAETSWSRRR